MAAEHWVAHLVRIEELTVVEDLLQGRVDLVLSRNAITEPDLLCEQVGVSRSSVYCGPEHPLAESAEAITEEQLRVSCFVALSTELADPAGPPRTVTIRCNSIEMVRTVCEESRFLAVLPDVLCRNAGREALVRLVTVAVTPAYAIRRRQVAGASVDDFTSALIAELRSGLV
jgi:DNA-binding transcriptional LysR family regulator